MVYESKPALNRVRITARDTSFPWTIKPFLDVCDEKESSGNEVVEEDCGDALVIVLRARGLLVNERVVDFDSRWSTERGCIEDGDGAFHCTRYALQLTGVREHPRESG